MKEKLDFIDENLNECITFPFWCRAFDESIIIGVTTVSSVIKFECCCCCCFGPRSDFRWNDERWWLFSSAVEEDFCRLSLIDVCSCLVILLRRLDSWDEEIWTLLERRALEKRLVLRRRKTVFSKTLLVDYLDLYLFDGLTMLVVGFLDDYKETSKIY